MSEDPLIFPNSSTILVPLSLTKNKKSNKCNFEPYPQLKVDVASQVCTETLKSLWLSESSIWSISNKISSQYVSNGGASPNYP